MVDLKCQRRRRESLTAWGLVPAQGPLKPNGFWCYHMHSEPSPVNKLCNFLPSYCELPCKFCQSHFLVKIMCKHVLWCLREYTPLTISEKSFLDIRYPTMPKYSSNLNVSEECQGYSVGKTFSVSFHSA